MSKKIKEPLLFGDNSIPPKANNQVREPLSGISNSQINYLSSAINFFSFLSQSIGLENLQIIPSIEIYALSATLNKINSSYGVDALYLKYHNIVFDNKKEERDWGQILFCLLSEDFNVKGLTSDAKKTLVSIKQLFIGMTEAQKGSPTVEVVLNILRKSKEIKKLTKLNNYIGSIKLTPFSQLNDLYDELIMALNESKAEDEYLKTWRTIIASYIWVIRYSSQKIEVMVDDLMKKNKSPFKELHIVLIGLFATKLFNSAPSWKPLGYTYQLYDKMKVLQPVAEVYYNPNIISSLSSDPIKQEEYFWTYIWGKPYSVFEKPLISNVKKLQKRMIEVDEEVIVEEKNYGNLFTTLGEIKPTGVIKLTNKVF
jgi:hypothetical protein